MQGCKQRTKVLITGVLGVEEHSEGLICKKVCKSQRYFDEHLLSWQGTYGEVAEWLKAADC